MAGSKRRKNAEEAKRFWSDIWDNPKEHKSDAKWLKDLREDNNNNNNNNNDDNNNDNNNNNSPKCRMSQL